MSKQQTAVEWLVQKVELISNNKTLSKKEAIDLYNKSIEQANEMFKQQIIDSNRAGVDMVIDKKPFITGEKYYNETFNK